LKKALERLLPKEIVHRGKKGFGVPIAKWVKGPLRELFEDLLSSERIKREGFLNPNQVTTLLQDHVANKKDNRKRLDRWLGIGLTATLTVEDVQIPNEIEMRSGVGWVTPGLQHQSRGYSILLHWEARIRVEDERCISQEATKFKKLPSK
jgi:hypothetical protein